MMETREPAVAGTFYTSDPNELRLDIQSFLDRAPLTQFTPKALVAPHAGYIYSGAIAASAYKTLAGLASQIKRVVILGPAHRVAFQGVATPACKNFKTPLGNVPVDAEAIEDIEQLNFVFPSVQAHAMEHSVEVQIPFLQVMLSNFSIVPLVVGDCRPEQVAEVIECLWRREGTFVVISSDLSHYHSYAESQTRDKRTSEKICQLDTHISGDEACGCRPLNGLLHIAKQRELIAEAIDVRNSGDTFGSKDAVVGYGAYVLH